MRRRHDRSPQSSKPILASIVPRAEKTGAMLFSHPTSAPWLYVARQFNVSAANSMWHVGPAQGRPVSLWQHIAFHAMPWGRG